MVKPLEDLLDLLQVLVAVPLGLDVLVRSASNVGVVVRALLKNVLGDLVGLLHLLGRQSKRLVPLSVDLSGLVELDTLQRTVHSLAQQVQLLLLEHTVAVPVKHTVAVRDLPPHRLPPHKRSPDGVLAEVNPLVVSLVKDLEEPVHKLAVELASLLPHLLPVSKVNASLLGLHLLQPNLDLTKPLNRDYYITTSVGAREGGGERGIGKWMGRGGGRRGGKKRCFSPSFFGACFSNPEKKRG